jgi:hypothetical protein
MHVVIITEINSGVEIKSVIGGSLRKRSFHTQLNVSGISVTIIPSNPSPENDCVFLVDFLKMGRLPKIKNAENILMNEINNNSSLSYAHVPSPIISEIGIILL